MTFAAFLPSSRQGIRCRMTLRVLLAGIVALASIALSDRAAAADSNCSVQSGGTLVLGDVAVAAGTPVGTLLGTAATTNMVFRCTNIPTGQKGQNLYIQASVLGPLDATDTKANGIIFATSVPGIALKVTGSPYQAKSEACPRCGPESGPGFEIGPVNRTGSTSTITNTFTAQLIKTGPITPGSIGQIQLLRFTAYEYGYTPSDPYMNTMLTLNTGTDVTVKSCSVNAGSTDLTVTMPSIIRTQIGAAVGSTAGRTRFTIDLTCETGSTARIAMTSGNIYNATQGILADTGTSTNIAVQMLKADTTPMPINNTAQVLGATPNGQWSVPFFVQYYRTSTNQIGTGTVRAAATFTLTYQ
ncbi:MAG TPA: fimbrial protein [Lysobacter sp.]